MGSETEAFLADMLPKQRAAERAIHDGNVEPRLALWSRNDPVSLYGAKLSASGWAHLEPIFHTVASWFPAPSTTSSRSSPPVPAGTSPTSSATNTTARLSMGNRGRTHCGLPTYTAARTANGASCTAMPTSHRRAISKAHGHLGRPTLRLARDGATAIIDEVALLSRSPPPNSPTGCAW